MNSLFTFNMSRNTLLIVGLIGICIILAFVGGYEVASNRGVGRQSSDISEISLPSSQSAKSNSTLQPPPFRNLNSAKAPESFPGPDSTNSNDKVDSQGMVNKMMRDPAMRKMLKDQLAAQLPEKYQSLFDELKLTPEQREKMLKALTDRSDESTDIGLDVLDGKKSKTELEGRSADMNQRFDGVIKDILGPAGFQKYLAFEKNIDLIQFYNLLTSQAAGSGQTIQAAQSQKLYAIVQQEFATVPWIGSTPDKPLTKTAINSYMNALQAAFQRISQRSREFLTPGQQAFLSEFLTRQLNIKEADLNAALQMFGRH